MGRLFGWRSLAVLTFAACSGENIAAPGVCPQFCAAVSAPGGGHGPARCSVERDSTYTGYVPDATQLMVTSPGAMVESRAVFRFVRFTDTIPLNLADTTTRPVLQTDSFRPTRLNRQTPNVPDKRYALYRPPNTVDSTTSYADLVPYFADSTLVLVKCRWEDNFGVGFDFIRRPGRLPQLRGRQRVRDPGCGAPVIHPVIHLAATRRCGTRSSAGS